MALTQNYPVFTKESYLDFERFSTEKHEFLDENVYAMAGESLNHSRICYGIVGNKLREKNCRGFLGWESVEIRGFEAVLEIDSIECVINLSELYEQIDFFA